MNTQKLIVFSAPSGSGKTTLVKHLLSQPELPLSFSISATSRQPRNGEVRDQDYYFLSVEDFKQKIKTNAFLEHEEVYPNDFYGTLKSEIERIWALNKAVIFDVDVIGGYNIASQFPDKTLSIFVRPPSIEELEKRLKSRGTESEEKIAIRIKKAYDEVHYAEKFDAIITNDNLNTAKEEAYQLVSKFLNK